MFSEFWTGKPLYALKLFCRETTLMLNQINQQPNTKLTSLTYSHGMRLNTLLYYISSLQVV